LIERGTKGSPRGVGPTRAGEVFLTAAGDLLSRAEQAVAAARQVHARTPLHVGFGTSTPRHLVRAVLDAADDAGQAVSLEHVPWGSEVAWLLDGRVDLVFLQAPADYTHPELCLDPLQRLRRLAVFHAGHRLAARSEITMADLADEPIIDAASDRAYWLVDPRPDGSAPAVVGPAARTVEEMLAFVSAGRGMAITSHSVAETSRSEELAFVPIRDLESATVHLATRLGDRRGEVAATRRAVTRSSGVRGDGPSTSAG
jgi:DNA-binding transcriptional LysR family regulator